MRFTSPAACSFSRCSSRVGLLRFNRPLRSVTVSRRTSSRLRIPTRTSEASALKLSWSNVILPPPESMAGIRCRNGVLKDSLRFGRSLTGRAAMATFDNCPGGLLSRRADSRAPCESAASSSKSTSWGGVPFRIVFNKVDRAKGSKIGPEESAWLREQFPNVPTSLTSAMTGEGVDDAFSGIIGQAVDAMLAMEKDRKVRKVLRHRILSAAARRDTVGISKNELFAGMRDAKPDEIMEELDNLVRLNILVQYDSGPKTFLKSSSAPASFRYQITPLGRKVAASPTEQDLVVE